MARKNTQAFTLIEVLVALAIMASVFSVVFPSFQQATVNSEKATLAQQTVMNNKAVFAALSAMNPFDSRTGTGKLGDIEYKWEAIPISGEIPVRTDDAVVKANAQMFQINVTYEYEQVQTVFHFEQLGWKSK